MGLSFRKFLPILKAIYNAFLKGRTVGGVTLPSESHGIPGRGSFDDAPHRPGPAALGLLHAPAAEQADARDALKPDDAEPPFPTKTLGFLLFLVFGVPLAVIVSLGLVEWRTLADDVPGNHITAALRRAFKAAPGAVALGLVVWVAFLAAIASGIGAHAWWS